MNNLINVGSDPRRLSDYAALRGEMSKLTHTARPEVNWQYAEKCCLSLFEQNGMELETAAWYTLTRTQLAGLVGLNEGLMMLKALIIDHWQNLWPQPIPARLQIVNSLSQHLQHPIRSLSLNDSELSQLYQASETLTLLGEVLQRLELKPLNQLEALRTLLHNSAIRLEKRGKSTRIKPIPQPDTALSIFRHGLTLGSDDTIARRPDNSMAWGNVAQPEQLPDSDVQVAVPTATTGWKFFAAGMCSMLAITLIAVCGWQYIDRQNPLQRQFAASLAPLPTLLTTEQLAVLRQQARLPPDFIAQTQQQLIRMESLPPDWNIHFSRKLIEQVQVLSPEQTKPLIQQWQQQLQVLALPTEAISGWHRGMIQLEKLTDKLNALDGQKGKYLTVSELKSQVFDVMTHFRRTVPVEEQFRLLDQLPEGSLQRQQQVRQVEQHLRAQIFRLAQEKQRDAY